MDLENLRTASLYINNQLLSRGLLRNGQTIDFASPDKGEGGLEATMGKVMGVINDLILRRDRDATQRENLSQTIRSLRADALRQTTDLERVSTKHAEAQRRLGIAEATERALKTQLRSAEQAAKGVKEEMNRIRSLVAQTRAQCANEVRKRERVIEGMKKHVADAGRPRGSGKVPGVATITVVPGIGVEIPNSGALGTDDTNYDLRMETNEFLTELARGLSEENENMARLIKRTIEALKALSGCELEGGLDGEEVEQLDSGYESMAAEMNYVIEHLRNLLTNPSFVPLEEVEIREEEIMRLRAGFEKMEGRWREAVQLMQGWCKRMASSGQTVNLEELKMGIRLSPLKAGEGDDSAADNILLEEYEEGDTQADIDAMDESGIAAPPEPELDDEESDFDEYEEEPVVSVVPKTTQEAPQELPRKAAKSPLEEKIQKKFIVEEPPSSSPGPPPQLSPLKETTKGNRGSYGHSQDGFTTIVEENTQDLLQLEKPSTEKPKVRISTPAEEKPSSKRRSSPRKSAKKESKPTSDIIEPSPRLELDETTRLPHPRDNVMPQQSPLTMATIAAKLAASEREADAARVRAKLKALRLSRTKPTDGTSLEATKPSSPVKEVESNDEAIEDDVANDEVPPKAEPIVAKKRKAISKSHRTSRRRSTLSPWELESLILGGNTESPAKASK
ncbi:Afadin and alpha-actinin-binding-domain-containing protein [Xylogone sp. PMI_703]|nr:Afadin and alpha-actinin-binding-domain-containing protein [Xylogone sp. PMI_703]